MKVLFADEPELLMFFLGLLSFFLFFLFVKTFAKFSLVRITSKEMISDKVKHFIHLKKAKLIFYDQKRKALIEFEMFDGCYVLGLFNAKQLKSQAHSLTRLLNYTGFRNGSGLTFSEDEDDHGEYPDWTYEVTDTLPNMVHIEANFMIISKLVEEIDNFIEGVKVSYCKFVVNDEFERFMSW